MPWQETDVAKERIKFVLEWEKRWQEGEGTLNFAALCREFGISRQQGYVWVERYRKARHSLSAVKERSRRPHTMPTKVPEEVEDALVAVRKTHPTWGPKKLRAWLLDRKPGLELPSASTIGEVLRRRGLTRARPRRVRGTKASTRPFADVTGPCATWCVDFKGHFRTRDGATCYPLTLIDAHSRFLVRCETLLDPDGQQVQRVFDSAFREFGLPATIRSDNGPPFASPGAGGLTKLSVWWLRLGIRVERIAPGKPQQNGRQERFHRTLKAETASPPKTDLRSQQRAFDVFRREYNEDRPHEALGQKTPASAFATSPRRYPRPLIRFEVAPWNRGSALDKSGAITWNKRRAHISSALAHEQVELRYQPETDDWLVVFGPVVLGVLREIPIGLAFKATRRRFLEDDDWKVSGMSSD